MRDNETAYALRLPTKLYVALQRIAKREGRSVNYLIAKACEAVAWGPMERIGKKR